MKTSGLPVREVVFGLALFFSSAASGAELCIGPSTDIRNPGLNVSVNCSSQPETFANEWIGFDTEADSSCRSSASLCEAFEGLPQYGWTISASSTDPYQNGGALESETAPDGFGTLYLWYACSTMSGLSAVTFDLVGSLDVLAFTPLNGFLNAGVSPSALMLAVGLCPKGPVVAGSILVREKPAASDEPPAADSPTDDTSTEDSPAEDSPTDG